MKNLVIVQSKTINNESIPIVFKTAQVMQGGEKDERELSRSYIFKNFQATIPLKLAKIIVKQSPKEFSIVKGLDKNPDKSTKRVLRVAKEKVEGFTCSHCGAVAKSKAGLTAHIRFNHPEKWEGKKEKK